MAGHDRMKGSANAAWITRVAKSPPVRSRSTVIALKIAAVERRKARVPVARHAGAFAKVPSVRLALFRRSASLIVRDKEIKAQPRADQTAGPMNHVCLNVRVRTRAV